MCFDGFHWSLGDDRSHRLILGGVCVCVGGGSLLSQTQAELSCAVTPETGYLLLPQLLSEVQ